MMKIDLPADNRVLTNTTVQPPPARAEQNASPSATATAAKSARSAGVAVTVSPLARSLGTAKTGDTADVDTNKVNSVRTAIEQGTYVVNAEVIADKLLANAQEMLNRTRS
jgi:negative regulator of flagellin synthesis FlgM